MRQCLVVVEARVIHASVEALKSAGRTVEKVGQQSKTTLTKVLDHIEVFFGWSGSRISRFRKEYADADLWLFFGFSILFIIAVFLGLYILAASQKYWQQAIAWHSSTGLSSVTS